MTQIKDCRILRQTSNAERLLLSVNGTNTPLGGYVFLSKLGDPFWTNRIQNFKDPCSDGAEHDLDFPLIEIVEVVGAHTDGVPHTLVTACACKRCGKSVRTAWGVEYKLPRAVGSTAAL
jgi:hypothetical protein